MKFEDLGQGGQRYALSGQSLTMIGPGGGGMVSWWWCQSLSMIRSAERGGMVILVVVSIIVNENLEGNVFARAACILRKC